MEEEYMLHLFCAYYALWFLGDCIPDKTWMVNSYVIASVHLISLNIRPYSWKVNESKIQFFIFTFLKWHWQYIFIYNACAAMIDWVIW